MPGKKRVRSPDVKEKKIHKRDRSLDVKEKKDEYVDPIDNKKLGSPKSLIAWVVSFAVSCALSMVTPTYGTIRNIYRDIKDDEYKIAYGLRQTWSMAHRAPLPDYILEKHPVLTTFNLTNASKFMVLGYMRTMYILAINFMNSMKMLRILDMTSIIDLVDAEKFMSAFSVSTMVQGIGNYGTYLQAFNRLFGDDGTGTEENRLSVLINKGSTFFNIFTGTSTELVKRTVSRLEEDVGLVNINMLTYVCAILGLAIVVFAGYIFKAISYRRNRRSLPEKEQIAFENIAENIDAGNFGPDVDQQTTGRVQTVINNITNQINVSYNGPIVFNIVQINTGSSSSAPADAELGSLISQMGGKNPQLYMQNGQLYLAPKTKRKTMQITEYDNKDEAAALVLAGMRKNKRRNNQFGRKTSNNPFRRDYKEHKLNNRSSGKKSKVKSNKQKNQCTIS